MNPFNPEQPDRSKDYVMYIVVNDELGQSPGKFSAQVGHLVEKITEIATLIMFDLSDDYFDYEDSRTFFDFAKNNKDCYSEYCNSPAKIVLGANKEEWEELKKLTCIVIVDEGRTEIPPNSETVLGFWPMRKCDAPEVIKNLNLKRCNKCSEYSKI